MNQYISFVSAALVGLAITTGASAADPKDSATPDAIATPAAKPARAGVADPKYCVVDILTGSRIAKKVCKTRREWMAEGVDPLNP